MDIIILAIMALLGLYMAWNIGANDVANSMADAVGSGALSVKKAVIAAGICEFAGAVLVGSHVTDTIRKGIVDPSALASMPGMMEGEPAALLVIGMSAALLSAAIWLNFATWTGMPVSCCRHRFCKLGQDGANCGQLVHFTLCRGSHGFCYFQDYQQIDPGPGAAGKSCHKGNAVYCLFSGHGSNPCHDLQGIQACPEGN
jgi:hypothetical protein